MSMEAASTAIRLSRFEQLKFGREVIRHEGEALSALAATASGETGADEGKVQTVSTAATQTTTKTQKNLNISIKTRPDHLNLGILTMLKLFGPALKLHFQMALII